MDERLNITFQALSDPTRRAIVQRLSQGDALVKDLADPFEISLPAICKHLKVLESAGLLLRQKNGRERRCSLVPGPLQQAEEWISDYQHFWETRLEKLTTLVESTSTNIDD